MALREYIMMYIRIIVMLFSFVCYLGFLYHNPNYTIRRLRVVRMKRCRDKNVLPI